MGHAGEGQVTGFAGGARGQGEAQQACAFFGVVAEHFVEVAHAEEENRVGVLTLKVHVLLHRRREFGSRWHGVGGFVGWGGRNKNAVERLFVPPRLVVAAELTTCLARRPLRHLAQRLARHLLDILLNVLLVVGVAPAFHLVVLVSVDLVGDDLLDGMFG